MIAFIFARGGSKRLKNKNLRLIAGKPLIYYSINLAKKIKKIKDIYVSTDSKKIAKISKKYGAKIILRPKKLANSKSIEFLSWKHAVKTLEDQNISFKHFISLPCTAPLRNMSDIYRCINKLKNKRKLVITGFESDQNTLVSEIDKSEEGFIFFKKKNVKKQKKIKVYNLTTVAYVTTKDYIKKHKNIFDGNISIVKIPKERAIDINDKFDFKIAKILIEKNVK